MLSEYRAFLEAELALLGNASHHAYSLGQANMAKRAIEKLDEETGRRILVELAPAEASEAITALEMLRERHALGPALDALRERIAAAVPTAGAGHAGAPPQGVPPSGGAAAPGSGRAPTGT